MPTSCVRRTYGPKQNVYRELFVFECAEAGRKFYIPNGGSMKMQFFHVEDLCRFIEILLEKHPAERVYNVGNPDALPISEWVRLCYDAVGAKLETVSVEEHPQRAYFCFHDYDYYLDVSRQTMLLPNVKPIAEGLKESYEWFCQNRDAVMRRPYMEYIDTYI